MPLSNTTIKYNSFTLPGVRDWRETMDARALITPLPRKDGAYIDDRPTLNVREISIAGQIVTSSETSTRTSLDNLMNAVGSGKHRLLIHSDRYILAVKKSFNHNFIRGFGGKALKYNVRFTAEDPYWYATVLSSITYTDTIAGGDADTNISVLTGGNAPTPPTITIKPNAAMDNIKIYNSKSTIDKWIRTTAETATGKLCTINADAKTISCAGTNGLASADGDFFNLEGGINNSLVFTSDASSSTVKIAWRNRWF